MEHIENTENTKTEKNKNATSTNKNRMMRLLLVARISVMLMWLILIIAGILLKDQISVHDIFRYTPSDPVLASLVLLCFFALKSMSMVIYVGILYAAAGMMFPLPWAIAVNILGTAVMVSIPYGIGRSGGAETLTRIIEKYPKSAIIKDIRKKSDFWFSLIVRLIGMFPSDIISIYMGAIEVRFLPYLLGCILGFLPPVITFSLMGMSLTDIHSPNFKIALGVEIACVVSSGILGYFYLKKRSNNQ